MTQFNAIDISRLKFIFHAHLNTINSTLDTLLAYPKMCTSRKLLAFENTG